MKSLPISSPGFLKIMLIDLTTSHKEQSPLEKILIIQLLASFNQVKKNSIKTLLGK